MVRKTLLDGHLLAILVATLPGEAHRLLAALVRGEIDEQGRRHLAGESRGSGTAMALQADTPADLLRGCALAFTAGGRLWSPTELHRRIDGVLRAFGV